MNIFCCKTTDSTKRELITVLIATLNQINFEYLDVFDASHSNGSDAFTFLQYQ